MLVVCLIVNRCPCSSSCEPVRRKHKYNSSGRSAGPGTGEPLRGSRSGIPATAGRLRSVRGSAYHTARQCRVWTIWYAERKRCVRNDGGWIPWLHPVSTGWSQPRIRGSTSDGIRSGSDGIPHPAPGIRRRVGTASPTCGKPFHGELLPLHASSGTPPHGNSNADPLSSSNADPPFSSNADPPFRSNACSNAGP